MWESTIEIPFSIQRSARRFIPTASLSTEVQNATYWAAAYVLIYSVDPINYS